MISLSVTLSKRGRSRVPHATLDRAPSASRRVGMSRANGLVIATHGSFVRLMFSGTAFPSQPATPSYQRARISIHDRCPSVQDVDGNQQIPRDSSPCLKAGAFSLALVRVHARERGRHGQGLRSSFSVTNFPGKSECRLGRDPATISKSGSRPSLPDQVGAQFPREIKPSNRSSAGPSRTESASKPPGLPPRRARVHTSRPTSRRRPGPGGSGMTSR